MGSEAAAWGLSVSSGVSDFSLLLWISARCSVLVSELPAPSQVEFLPEFHGAAFSLCSWAIPADVGKVKTQLEADPDNRGGERWESPERGGACEPCELLRERETDMDSCPISPPRK